MLVGQYLTSYNEDESTRHSDPMMMTLPPVSQYMSQYHFTTIDTFKVTTTFENHVSLVIETGHFDGLLLDGQNVSPISERHIWHNLPGLPLSALIIKVAEGPHNLSHITDNVTFAAILYGFKMQEAYGLNLGHKTVLLDKPCSEKHRVVWYEERGITTESIEDTTTSVLTTTEEDTTSAEPTTPTYSVTTNLGYDGGNSGGGDKGGGSGGSNGTDNGDGNGGGGGNGDENGGDHGNGNDGGDGGNDGVDPGDNGGGNAGGSTNSTTENDDCDNETSPIVGESGINHHCNSSGLGGGQNGTNSGSDNSNGNGRDSNSTQSNVDLFENTTNPFNSRSASAGSMNNVTFDFTTAAPYANITNGNDSSGSDNNNKGNTTNGSGSQSPPLNCTHELENCTHEWNSTLDGNDETKLWNSTFKNDTTICIKISNVFHCYPLEGGGNVTYINETCIAVNGVMHCSSTTDVTIPNDDENDSLFVNDTVACIKIDGLFHCNAHDSDNPPYVNETSVCIEASGVVYCSPVSNDGDDDETDSAFMNDTTVCLKVGSLFQCHPIQDGDNSTYTNETTVCILVNGAMHCSPISKDDEIDSFINDTTICITVSGVFHCYPFHSDDNSTYVNETMVCAYIHGVVYCAPILPDPDGDDENDLFINETAICMKSNGEFHCYLANGNDNSTYINETTVCIRIEGVMHCSLVQTGDENVESFMNDTTVCIKIGDVFHCRPITGNATFVNETMVCIEVNGFVQCNHVSTGNDGNPTFSNETTICIRVNGAVHCNPISGGNSTYVNETTVCFEVDGVRHCNPISNENSDSTDSSGNGDNDSGWSQATPWLESLDDFKTWLESLLDKVGNWTSTQLQNNCTDPCNNNCSLHRIWLAANICENSFCAAHPDSIAEANFVTWTSSYVLKQLDNSDHQDIRNCVINMTCTEKQQKWLRLKHFRDYFLMMKSYASASFYFAVPNETFLFHREAPDYIFPFTNISVLTVSSGNQSLIFGQSLHEAFNTSWNIISDGSMTFLWIDGLYDSNVTVSLDTLGDPSQHWRRLTNVTEYIYSINAATRVNSTRGLCDTLDDHISSITDTETMTTDASDTATMTSHKSTTNAESTSVEITTHTVTTEAKFEENSIASTDDDLYSSASDIVNFISTGSIQHTDAATSPAFHASSSEHYEAVETTTAHDADTLPPSTRSITPLPTTSTIPNTGPRPTPSAAAATSEDNQNTLIYILVTILIILFLVIIILAAILIKKKKTRVVHPSTPILRERRPKRSFASNVTRCTSIDLRPCSALTSSSTSSDSDPFSWSYGRLSLPLSLSDIPMSCRSLTLSEGMVEAPVSQSELTISVPVKKLGKIRNNTRKIDVV